MNRRTKLIASHIFSSAGVRLSDEEVKRQPMRGRKVYEKKLSSDTEQITSSHCKSVFFVWPSKMYSWLNWKPSFTFLICAAEKEKICLIPGEIIALVFMMDVFHISLNSVCANMGQQCINDLFLPLFWRKGSPRHRPLRKEGRRAAPNARFQSAASADPGNTQVFHLLQAVQSLVQPLVAVWVTQQKLQWKIPLLTFLTVGGYCECFSILLEVDTSELMGFLTKRWSNAGRANTLLDIRKPNCSWRTLFTDTTLSATDGRLLLPSFMVWIRQGVPNQSR